MSVACGCLFWSVYEVVMVPYVDAVVAERVGWCKVDGNAGVEDG